MKPKQELHHTTTGIWCHCDPKWLSLCWLCEGAGKLKCNDRTCALCRGTGMLFAIDPDLVDLVVHRITTESPYT